MAEEKAKNSVVSGPPASLTSEHSGMSRLSISVTSQHTEVSNTSFHDMVTINEEGHPYIDINRLIFRPVKHHHHHTDEEHSRKEKLSWYVPDFCFIIFNLISLCISTYFCLIGTSTLTWKASIGMFSVPPCIPLINGTGSTSPERENNFYFLPCRTFAREPDFSPSKGYNFYSANSFPILRTKLTDVHYFGLVLICVELVNVINVVVGINACLQGYKAILIQHIAVDGLIVLGEFIISAVVAFTSVCDIRDLKAIRVILKNFINWYGTILKPPEFESDKEKLVNAELDALQISLGCCGVDSWSDYLANRYVFHDWYQSTTQLDDTEMVIPYSCCRSWWVRNIYCSHGVHLWAHPMASEEMSLRFQERIVQEGCIYKLEKLCLNLRELMGHYGFIATLLHLIFVIIEAISALVLIKNINNLIREKKKLMRRKEMLHEDDGSELDFSTGRSSMDEGKGKSHWSKVPPPTEDEIITIKQRSNFNSFMSRVKGGFVSKWMAEAQAIVTEGQEGHQEQDITAEEKKRREKEMLHGKAKQAPRDDRRVSDDKTKRGAKGKPRKEVKKVVVAKKKPEEPDHSHPPQPPPELPELEHPPESFKPAPQTEAQLDSFVSKFDPKKKKSAAPHHPSHPHHPPHSTHPPAKGKPHKKKTKVLWKKEVAQILPVEPDASEVPTDEAQIEVEAVEEVPTEAETVEQTETEIEEPPPLTSETDGYATATDDAHTEGKSKRRKRKKRKKRKVRGKEPWFKNW